MKDPITALLNSVDRNRTEGWTCSGGDRSNHYYRDFKSMCGSNQVPEFLRPYHRPIIELWSRARCEKCMKLRGKELGKERDYRGHPYMI